MFDAWYFQIRCERVRSLGESLKSISSSEKFHLKGFTKSLIITHYGPSLFPDDLREILIHFHYLIWDGDHFSLDSFTLFILEYIKTKYEKHQNYIEFNSLFPNQNYDPLKECLCAFKYEHEEACFLDSWHNKLVSLPTSTPCYIEHHGQVGETSVVPSTKFLNVTILYDLIQTNASLYHPIKDSIYQWIDLGMAVLELTQAVHVVCIGGGETCKQEYLQTLKICQSDPSRNYCWYIYALRRRRNMHIGDAVDSDGLNNAFNPTISFSNRFIPSPLINTNSDRKIIIERSAKVISRAIALKTSTSNPGSIPTVTDNNSIVLPLRRERNGKALAYLINSLKIVENDEEEVIVDDDDEEVAVEVEEDDGFWLELSKDGQLEQNIPNFSVHIVR
jgi:hypothetical protein